MSRSRPDGSALRAAEWRRQRGITLMEMIIFIVILGLLAAAVITAFTNPLSGAGSQERAVFITQLAQERLEVVLGQKRREGFPGSDPCASGAALATCSVPAGFSINTSFGAWSVDPDTDNYRVITVTVTPPAASSYSVHTLVTKLGGS